MRRESEARAASSSPGRDGGVRSQFRGGAGDAAPPPSPDDDGGESRGTERGRTYAGAISPGTSSSWGRRRLVAGAGRARRDERIPRPRSCAPAPFAPRR
mmetsp:Transcript_20819/g.47116  ORF Transcript_20819/g.47116 Transcript_20819/m.47116 type:complete len:99 (+) Transcript_20819:659-955(+)